MLNYDLDWHPKTRGAIPHTSHVSAGEQALLMSAQAGAVAGRLIAAWPPGPVRIEHSMNEVRATE